MLIAKDNEVSLLFQRLLNQFLTFSYRYYSLKSIICIVLNSSEEEE